jgi:hypothetical protein
VDPSANGPDQPAEPEGSAPSKWPSISDYWPDNPRRRGPAAADSLSQPVDEGVTWIRARVARLPADPGRGRLRLVLGSLLAGSLLVIVGVVMATLVKPDRIDLDAVAGMSLLTVDEG